MATPIASQTYSATEDAEIQQWLTTSERLRQPPTGSETGSILEALNTHLASRTTLLGVKPSKADVAIYEALAPAVRKWTPEERTGESGHPNIVRHLDFVQSSKGIFGLDVAKADMINVDPEEILYVKPPVDAKAEKERLKKEKAAAAAAAAAAATGGAAVAGGTAAAAKGSDTTTLVNRTKDVLTEAKDKVAAAVTGDSSAASGTSAAAVAGAPQQQKPKKEKAPKQPKSAAAPATPAPLSPAVIDLRVGHILKAIKHPEADSLYVSTIAMGDPADTPDTETYKDPTTGEESIVRTVCSGLNGLIPLEEMQNRKVIVVCNLKPVKMRGIKSCAMVLAASPRLKEGEVDDHKGPVELVSPPEGAKAGEKVWFEGWNGAAEKQLNPKKKQWEMYQPGFTTTEEGEVGFDAGVVKELEGKDGVGKLVVESGGVCTVNSLKGATVR